MITLPRLSKPRQKINLLIATMFAAVQIPVALFAIAPANANRGNENRNNGSNNQNDNVVGIPKKPADNSDNNAADHCDDHNNHPNKVESSSGDKTVNGVAISWSGDPGEITFTNTNDVDATITWCAKGGNNFSGDSQTTGTVSTVVKPGEKVTIDNLNTEISYFIHYNVVLSEPRPVVLGSITIIKDADSAELQEFIFSATGLEGGVTTFSLFDQEGDTVTEQNKKTYPNLTAKEYSFTEQAKAGWTLANINCTKVKPTTVVTVAIPKVTINLAQGDNVECKFVNTLNNVVTEDEEEGAVLGDTDEVVAVGGQGGAVAVLGEQGSVLGAQTVAPVGGVAAGYGAAASTSLSSLAGLGASLSALGYGVASLRKRQ